VNWIATIDPANPTRITSEPVRLRPLQYGWDYNNGNETAEGGVQEGAHVIVHDGVITMAYSGASVNRTYVIGRMTATPGTDLLNPDNWKNDNYPMLTSDWENGVYGPGHNSFIKDEDGVDLLVFHARNDLGGSRDTMIRRIHWAADGYPILDMTRDEEVKPDNRAVTATVVVEAAEETVDISAAATVRCVAGKPYLAVTTTNDDDASVSLAITTPYGSKSVASLASGKSVSHSFGTRVEAIAAGAVTVTATSLADGHSVTGQSTATYAATSCQR